MKKFVLLCSMIWAIYLCAQDSDKKDSQNSKAIDSHLLESVTTTATTGSLLATDISKIPGNISVVDSKRINQTPNSKLTDVVKALAGVKIERDVSFNPRPKIKMRGISYGTLIMLDNIILTDLEGENRLLNQISLYDVERVEVARGSFSSLYGSNAIGGAINFITSMPTKFEVEALGGYGNEFVPNTAEKNLTRLYFSIGNVFFNKRLRVKLSAGMNNSQGYVSGYAYLNSLPTGNMPTGWYYDKAGRVVVGDEGRREWQNWDTRLKLEWDMTEKSTLSSMISVSNSNYEFVNPTTLLRDSNGNPTYLVPDSNGNLTLDPFIGSGYEGYGSYTHMLGSLTYKYYFDNESELKISLSSVNLLSRWIDALQGSATQAGGAGYTQDINTSSNYLDIIYHTPIGDKHSLSSALQFRYMNYDQLNFNVANWRDENSVLPNAYQGYGGEAFVASAYVNWEAQWLDSLSSTIGLRYDYWLNFSDYMFGPIAQGIDTNIPNQHTSQFSPKASLNYQPFSWWILKTSVGSGFRMATIRDKYQISHGRYVWNINPYLKPETAISFEIGSEMKFKYYEMSLYYFQTEMSDMIYRQGAGVANSPYQYANAGYGRINGVELSVAIPLYIESLRLEGNYTFTNAQVLKNDADPSSIGKQLVEIPKHMGNITLSYGRNKGFYGSLWATFTSAFYSDSVNSTPLYHTMGYFDAQFSLNAKLGYIMKNGVDISASFLNMTNNQYYDMYKVAGASFYLQARYKL